MRRTLGAENDSLHNQETGPQSPNCQEMILANDLGSRTIPEPPKCLKSCRNLDFNFVWLKKCTQLSHAVSAVLLNCGVTNLWCFVMATTENTKREMQVSVNNKCFSRLLNIHSPKLWPLPGITGRKFNSIMIMAKEGLHKVTSQVLSHSLLYDDTIKWRNS